MLNANNICTKRLSKKFAPRISGPSKILDQYGELTFKLKLLEHWKIHPVFHVSLLEPYRISVRPVREQPPVAPEEMDG